MLCKAPKDPHLIILTKKQRTLKIWISNDKDYETVKNYILSCFKVKEVDEEMENYQGYFATLGKGTISLLANQFQVTSGILVSETIKEENNSNSKFISPNKQYIQDQEFKKRK